jgi:hypothetical protein
MEQKNTRIITPNAKTSRRGVGIGRYLDVDKVRGVAGVVPDLDDLAGLELLEVHVVAEGVVAAQTDERGLLLEDDLAGRERVLTHVHGGVEHVHHKPAAAHTNKRKNESDDLVRKNEERKERNATAKERKRRSGAGRVQVRGGIHVGTLVDDGAVHEGNRATAGLEGERISVASIHARAHAKHELLTCEMPSSRE